MCGFCSLATLTVRAASETISPSLIIIEAEDFASKIDRNGQSWEFTNSVANFVDSGYMQALPDLGNNLNTTWTNSSPELQYPINFTTTGTFNVWIRGFPFDDNDNSLHAGLDGQTGAASRIAWTQFGSWTWTNGTFTGGQATIDVTSTGLHTFSIWMREDGTRVDRIVLATSTAFRARTGNAWHIPTSVESPVGSMRSPMQNIFSNSAVTIYSGNQYQGAGEAGNQLQSGSGLYYKNATGSVWNLLPMTFVATTNNNIYYSATIASNLFTEGDVVQYYLRIPYSDYLTTYLGSSGGSSTRFEDESHARENPFSFAIQDPTQTNSPVAYFASPDDWRDQNIYFIFNDRFSDGNAANNNANPQSGFDAANSRRIHGGDFKGIEQKLDYIKALGATTIWITPIPQNVGHSAYHGYGADNFYLLQPNWGSMTDLSNMVKAAHSKGMYVILDVVCNHKGNRVSTSSSTFSLAGYPINWNNATHYPAPFNQLTNFHNNGGIQNYVDPDQILGELSGLDDLRTETMHVRTNMVNIYKYWIQAADFDGFRLDTVKHTDIGFWQYFNAEIRSFAASIGKTNFFQFGEVFDGSDGKCGYYTGTKAGGAFANDSVLDYPLFFKVNSVFATASGNTKQLEDRYNAISGNYDPSAEYRLVTFLDNHDQQRFMSANNANNNTGRLAVALSFLYSSRGIPCLYYGTEQNFNGSGDPNNREDMFDGQFESGPSLGDNYNMTQGSFLHIAKLNNFRRLYPSLRRGTHVNLWNESGGPGRYAFARRLGPEEVFIVFNTGSGTLVLPNRPTSYAAGTVLVNMLDTNEKVTVVAGVDGIPSISIGPSATKMFISEALWKPLDPVVVIQSPSHGATNFVANNSISLTFSKPMNTNAAQNAFSVTPPVNGFFTWSTNRTVMTFTPAPGFAGSSKIVLRVNTNAFDTASTNHVYSPFETFFHTAPASYTDAVPPTVVLSSPATASTVTGQVVVSGTAADNVFISKVEVRINGGDWIPATGAASWNLTFDSGNFLNGSHVISARATDTSGNVSTNAQIQLSFFNIPGEYVRRINAGGGIMTNCDDQVWLADRAYFSGSFGYINGTNGFVGNTISNICPTGQLLYQQERYSSPDGTFGYVFDCPEGRYETVIFETETWHTNAGERQFDLYIQGERMLADFDIFAESGGMNIPMVLAFTNNVTDAKLEMSFVPRQNNARVSAVQVTRIGDVDSDNDGVPNWWQLGWFDHPTGQDVDQSNAWDDPDGDGYNNGEEYIAMTSPIDGMSFPFILDLVPETDSIISVPTMTGRFYHLDWKRDVTTTDAWTTIEGNVPGNGSIVDLIDTNDTDQGIYRVRISLP